MECDDLRAVTHAEKEEILWRDPALAKHFHRHMPEFIDTHCGLTAAALRQRWTGQIHWPHQADSLSCVPANIKYVHVVLYPSCTQFADQCYVHECMLYRRDTEWIMAESSFAQFAWHIQVATAAQRAIMDRDTHEKPLTAANIAVLAREQYDEAAEMDITYRLSFSWL